ncbi:MAG: DUF2802 domain-containing protein [Zoogloeaceae bacterium]|jgi:replicative superfamily II helicase|nr:DUF2802 domain-containing protein [Zoogloeaceae bacterium]
MAWREVLLGLILVIVAYMVWLLWRMRALNRKKPSPPREFREPSVVRTRETQDTALKAYRHATAEEHDFETESAHGDEEEEDDTQARETRSTWSAEKTADLVQQTFMDSMERELARIGEEVDALRGALADLREDLVLLREDFQQEIATARTAQNASPLYNDAMQMAILGHDSLTISERCGISRAEADLVVALVKNRQPSGTQGPP